jgi:hypothetical protein
MKQSAYYPLCASEDLQIEETATEVIVFDSKNKKFHFLNATAYNILKACNGANNIRDIAGMLARQFDSEDVDSLVNDVAETVSALQDKGLMMFVAHDPELEQPPSDSTAESPLLAVSVTGASMFPVLLSGDKVLVKKSSLEELSAGDIIVWSDESLKRVAHRILSMDVSAIPPLITTKGDRGLRADSPIEFDRVLGKIVAVLRDGEVKWMTQLDENNKNHSSKAEENGKGGQPAVSAIGPKQKPSYKNLMVLDLREISVESIRNIESVDDVSLVLLAPENAHAWSEVPAQHVKTVFTAPPDYRVYTGQPELLPDMLEFLEAPLRLVVSGQLFLTAFEPEQISKALKELILIGQAYVSSDESKAALGAITNIVSGAISVVPRDHARWIGQSILGPEYLSHVAPPPLVVIGDLDVSERLGDIPDSIRLFR